MKEQEIKTLVLETLPTLIAKDPYVRESVWHIMTPYFAPREETESRFDRMMAELQRMREDFERKWEESDRRWEEQRQESARMREDFERRWEEQRQESARMREDFERRWEESDRRWEEFERRWEEQRQESDRRWEEQQELNRQLRTDIAKVDRRIDTTIGALGARWGINSETAFRNALRGILEEVAHVQVLRINEFDDEGMVFGRPDQVELDIVIHNGLVMLCELKSSMSKGEVATFERKAQFYAKRHQRTVTHKVIVSPMVDPRALPLAQSYGMHVYSNAEDVVLDDMSAEDVDTL